MMIIKFENLTVDIAPVRRGFLCLPAYDDTVRAIEKLSCGFLLYRFQHLSRHPFCVALKY
jgi:hypothetical protein